MELAPWWKHRLVAGAAAAIALTGGHAMKATLTAWMGWSSAAPAPALSTAFAQLDRAVNRLGSTWGVSLVALPLVVVTYCVCVFGFAWFGGVTGIIGEETGIGAMIALRAPGIHAHPAYAQVAERAAEGRTQCRAAGMIIAALGAVIVGGFGAAQWVMLRVLDAVRPLVGVGSGRAVGWVIPLVLLALVVPIFLLLGELLGILRHVFRER